ncbi:proton-coupled folate transporter-like [Gigantopelta aegis]|uniref:proton-coupled folate transporter-like n=1 Tax=Gigantopelta aegis TaxID=1735272 RepID=UPI001B88C799|nr:proton-coupled folate transporter-like [Gigantopelta aegis]
MFLRFCFRLIMNNIAEIVLFLYKTGESMLDATIRPYLVQAVCRDMFHDNMSMCNSTHRFYSVQNDVQSNAARYLMYYRILVSIPAVLLGLLCGAWSDRNGRKFPMMVPGIGSVLAVIVYLISMQYEELALPLILIGAATQGIFGKSAVITMAVNSYASDISDSDQRTQKLGRLLAMNFMGLFVGSLLSGTIQDAANIQITLCVVSAFHALSVLAVVFCMPESIPEQTREKDTDSSCTLFSFSGMKQSLVVLCKERKENSRMILIILFICSIINQTCKVGDADVTVLFVQRSPLFWPESWYGYLLSMDYAVMGVCLLLFLPLLSNVFTLPDITIMTIGIFCKLVRSIWAGFCSESWMVYTSVVIGSMAGMISSVIRSLMSKHVQEDELGKTFSLLASGETGSKLLGSVIFTNIYGASVYFFPGFSYMIEAVLYLVMFWMMVWLYREIQFNSNYNLLLAFADKRDYGTDDLDKSGKEIDEITSEPIFPQPLPATTP